LRAAVSAGRSWSGTTINLVPIYEFECRSCGHRFEELVGSHVGVAVEDLHCPECAAADLERLVSTTYAPIQHQLTPAEKRRREDKRGVDRGGAKERFKRQRAAERRAARGGGTG
jgi:putative FmdB family regulatory protein